MIALPFVLQGCGPGPVYSYLLTPSYFALFCKTSYRLCWKVVHSLVEVPTQRCDNPHSLSSGEVHARGRHHPWVGTFLHPCAHTGEQPHVTFGAAEPVFLSLQHYSLSFLFPDAVLVKKLVERNLFP